MNKDFLFIYLFIYLGGRKGRNPEGVHREKATTIEIGVGCKIGQWGALLFSLFFTKWKIC